MAKSKAKKYREKLEREGRRNPESNRISWSIDPLERKTKTKTEKLRQIEKQENKKLKETSIGVSFEFCLIINFFRFVYTTP